MNWLKSSAMDLERRIKYAELVAEKYEQQFGYRLTIDQILSPGKPSTIFTETDERGEIIAGVKLSPLRGSFSEQFVGDKKLSEVLGDIPTDQVVEVSKAINLGSMLIGYRLIARCYQWIEANSDFGFVSLGRKRTIKLYNWALSSWDEPWNVDIYPIPEPQIEYIQSTEFILLWARPRAQSSGQRYAAPIVWNCKAA